MKINFIAAFLNHSYDRAILLLTHWKNGMKTAELFDRYVQICNRALEANKDRFPFKHILLAAAARQGSRAVAVSIINDKPDADFVIKIDNNQVKGQKHNTSDCCCEGHWRVNKTYLEDVINNPEIYIDNPARLDWDWMYAQAEN